MKMRFLAFCLCLVPVGWAQAADASDSHALESNGSVTGTDSQSEAAGALSHEEQVAMAKRALAAYDASMSPWTLTAQEMREIVMTSGYHYSPQAQSGHAFDMLRPSVVEQRYIQSDSGLPGRAVPDFNWSGERFEEKVEDFIYPGFGRIESTTSRGAKSRIDYIDPHRCRMHGWGICWSIKY